MTTEFDHIYLGLSPEVGSKCIITARLAYIDWFPEFRVAASGMGWKGVDTEGQTLLSSGNIKWAQWLRVARNFQLRVGLKDRKKVIFDGFLREVSDRLLIIVHKSERFACLSRQDHDRLASLLKQHFGVTLEVKDVSVKGWNWGVTDFQGVSVKSIGVEAAI